MRDSTGTEYAPGLLVTHPRMPLWGPGRILDVDGTKVVVYFRDLSGAEPEAAVRTIDTRYVPLARAESQSDPFLDNLPPYANGRFQRSVKKRVTLPEGLEEFRSHHPLFFEDPAYVGDLKTGERAYKWAAHEQFEAALGGGRLRSLLREGKIDEVRSHALGVEERLNLVAVYEKAAFRDGLRDDAAARRYFAALLDILEAPVIAREPFEAYLHAVDSLPSEEGKTSPAKWTVATILPFIAQPDRFMFLKPEVTQDCANRLTFDLDYRPQLNWPTYAKLLEMSGHLLETLRPYGARDYIDVQSFIWLIGGGWES
ncbi:MAG TPA: DUF3553 domain-containing protein [Thermoanaerobaculia bacterium]|nr:DUF3553 domain-containing protein [Thermoanaerobaculia bacterium]